MKVLITEKQLQVLVLEQKPDSMMPFQPEKYGYDPKKPETLKPALEAQSKSIKSLVEALKNTEYSDFIRILREVAYSPEGISTEIFLSAIGLPEPAILTYAILLIDDINSAYNGNVNWFNIIFDSLALLTSGASSAVLNPLRNIVGKNVKSLPLLLNTMKKTNYWDKIKILLMSLLKGIVWLLGKIAKGFNWLGKKFGNTYIGKQINELRNFIEQNFANGLRQLGVSEKIATAGGTTAKEYVTLKVADKAIRSGIEQYYDYKYKGAGSSIPMITLDPNYQPSAEDIEDAKMVDFD